MTTFLFLGELTLKAFVLFFFWGGGGGVAFFLTEHSIIIFVYSKCVY